MLVLAGRFGAGQRGYAVGLLNGRHFHRRDRHSAFVAVLRLVRTVRQIKAVKIPAYVEFFVLRIDQLPAVAQVGGVGLLVAEEKRHTKNRHAQKQHSHRPGIAGTAQGRQAACCRQHQQHRCQREIPPRELDGHQNAPHNRDAPHGLPGEGIRAHPAGQRRKAYGPQAHADILAVHAFRLRIALPQGQPAPQQYKAARQQFRPQVVVVFLPTEQLGNTQAAVFHDLAAVFGAAGVHIIVIAAQHQSQERQQEPQVQQHGQRRGLEPGKQHRLCKRAAQMQQAEHRRCQHGHFQREQVYLQQHAKAHDQFGAGLARTAAGQRLFTVQLVQRGRDQRQKHHGCVLPHRTEPVNFVQVVGGQHVQGTAHQRCFV